MLLIIIIVIALGAIIADVWWYRARVRGCNEKIVRLGFIIWCSLTLSLPLILQASYWVTTDNSTTFMLLSMWGIWGWIVTVPTRLIYYALAAIGMPRLAIAISLGVVAMMVWGVIEGRQRLRVNRVEVTAQNLPASFEGLRVVQISDIHIGTLVNPERELTRLVERINELEPDLVAFCGDLVNIRDTELSEPVAAILGRIRAPYGVVSVVGNHDVGRYIRDTVTLPAELSLERLIARQRAMGWRVLVDSTIYLRRGGDSIALTGLSFDPAMHYMRHAEVLPAGELEKAYAGVPESLFDITVVHLPQLWDQLLAVGRGDLTLSGHVHAMQFKFRAWGRYFSPAAWLYERWSGKYSEQNSTLYINDGIGYVAYPMRLGANPEITLLTLQR